MTVGSPSNAAEVATADSSGAGSPPVRIVVAVSVDGLSPAAIRKLGRDGTPNLHRMLRKGAGTLNARTAREMTVTLPNHSGMLTGRRIRGAQGHHVDVNVDPGSTVHARAGAYRASLFDVAHDRGVRTALLASKEKFALFDRSWNAKNGAVDGVGADQGRDKIDRYVYDASHRLVDRVERRMRWRVPQAMFVHIALPDQAGHADGFMSAGYLQAVRRSDRLVGRIMKRMRSTRYLRRHSDLVVTADHGGIPGRHDHGDRTARANYTVPFLVWGVDAAKGVNLYRLNPERVRPKTGRPGYARPPVRNLDVANVVTSLLGAPRVPGSLAGTTPLSVS